MTPEQKARKKIDRQLELSGWLVQDHAAMNITAVTGEPHEKRLANWSEKKPGGRWRSFTYEEIIKRDKVNLDIFCLKDKNLEDSEDLPEPDVLAQEFADDLQTALEQFTAFAGELGE